MRCRFLEALDITVDRNKIAASFCKSSQQLIPVRIHFGTAGFGAQSGAVLRLELFRCIRQSILRFLVLLFLRDPGGFVLNNVAQRIILNHNEQPYCRGIFLFAEVSGYWQSGPPVPVKAGFDVIPGHLLLFRHRRLAAVRERHPDGVIVTPVITLG